LKEAGAKVVSRLFGPTESRLDCIVIEKEPSYIVAEKALQLNIPLLSLEWVIQCLITQQLQPFLSKNDSME